MKKTKFTEIYQNIIKDYISMDELRKVRNRMAIIKNICMLMIFILVLKLYWNIFIAGKNFAITENYIWIFGIFIFIFINIKISTKTFDTKIEYNTEYKEKVIRPLIEQYNGTLKYQPLGAEMEHLYKLGNFEYYEYFFSEDYIYGNNLKMSEIRTEREEQEIDGKKTKYIVFEGLFTVFETQKFVSRSIEIVFDKGLDKNINSSKVLMDSGEFENYFDVHGAEKIEIMQVLTSDVMDTILKVKRKCKCNFSIKFVGNKIFIRYYTGNIFEALGNKNTEFTMDLLKYYYDLIDNTLLLSEYLVKSVNECEI